MKATKIKFLGNGDADFKNSVHFTGATGGDFTLCGLTLDGDTVTTGDFKPTKDKVSCRDCQEIVTYCKSIRKTW